MMSGLVKYDVQSRTHPFFCSFYFGQEEEDDEEGEEEEGGEEDEDEPGQFEYNIDAAPFSMEDVSQ